VKVNSMTGYGRGEARAAGWNIVVEGRSVNHRFLEIVVRVPKDMLGLEERMKREAADWVSRGRIDLFLSAVDEGDRPRRVYVDKGLAIAYDKSLKELADVLGYDGSVGLMDIAALPEVLRVEEQAVDVETLWPVVKEALAGAMRGICEMRAAEGRNLAGDMLGRLERVEELAAQIERRVPAVTEGYRRSLLERIEELASGAAFDSDRIEMEVALLAERSNITEELVRINSHAGQLRECLEAGGIVGRKIEFILQEIHREVNTIGSKAADSTIGNLVVEIKSELEKMREQAQNIE